MAGKNACECDDGTLVGKGGGRHCERFGRVAAASHRHPIGIPSAPGQGRLDNSVLPRPSILPVKVHPQPTVMIY